MDTQYTVQTKTGGMKIGKKVSNELPQVKDATVNLRDRVNDILITEKHNLVTYQIGINEIINDDLRQVLMDNRNRLQGIHQRCFDELFNLGEYQADMANKQEIANTVDTFTNYKVQLSFK